MISHKFYKLMQFLHDNFGILTLLFSLPLPKAYLTIAANICLTGKQILNNQALNVTLNFAFLIELIYVYILRIN